jgi:hypothetical protein
MSDAERLTPASPEDIADALQGNESGLTKAHQLAWNEARKLHLVFEDSPDVQFRGPHGTSPACLRNLSASKEGSSGIFVSRR